MQKEDFLCFVVICCLTCLDYDSNGIANKVSLPDVDNLFESKEEFVDYLNKLYEENREWN